MRPTCALKISILVICGKFVGSSRLHRNKLANSRIRYARPVECNQQRTMPAVKIAGIESQRDALLLLVLPVEAAVQNIQVEVAIHDQVVSRGQICRESRSEER